MKFNFEPSSGDKGIEKIVMPVDSARVIKIFKEPSERSPEFLKAQFYLGKILHMLQPDNFPDNYQVHHGKNTDEVYLNGIPQHILQQRLALSAEHSRWQEKINKVENNSPSHLDHQEQMHFYKYKNELMRKENAKKVLRFLYEILLPKAIDNTGNNITTSGSDIVWVDDIHPWDVTDYGEIKFNIRIDAIEEEISKTSTKSLKDLCLVYLDRILVLYEQEKSNLKKYNQN